MAKLSARGRHELYRVAKTRAVPEVEGSLAELRIAVQAVMSDNTILLKGVIKLRNGKFIRYPWRVLGKLGDADLPKSPEAYKEFLISKGYELIKPGTRLA